MRVSLLFFGGSRDASGRPDTLLELADGATLGEAAARVAQDFPDLAPLLHTCRWARNLEFAALDAVLCDGDEIALIPPVAGGSGRAALTLEPLEPATCLAQVLGPQVGATVMFIGTVRAQARGREVRALDYEAYEGMALRQLERIAATCEEHHEGARVAIAHRHGHLTIGDVSVVIAAAAPHRREAFAACREAIEAIKVDVPIWKKETTTDGDTWVGWGGG